MSESKYYTLMLIPDGTENRKGVKVRQWLFKLVVSVFILLQISMLVFLLFYGQIVTRATEADAFEKENERLRKYQYKVQLLEKNLLEARDIVTRLTKLAGIDFTFPELPDDSTLFATFDQKRNNLVPRSSSNDFSYPSGLPIAGFVSQDFKAEDGQHYHPGVDIACAEGLPVLATAKGVVMYADFDSTYGYMVVLEHNDTTSTVYGHNKELLVKVGDNILAGGRIALSGNTGKSTAPHVHYELRINNEPIDPLGN